MNEARASSRAHSEALWADTVNYALDTSEGRLDELAADLAKDWKTDKGTVKRKFLAIRFVFGKGLTRQEIKNAGQHCILSQFAKAKKNGHNEKERFLRWRVPISLADAIDQDVARVARVCQITASEELFDLFHSLFMDMTEAQWRHAAGMSRLKRK